jgi:hypothetical protein
VKIEQGFAANTIPLPLEFVYVWQLHTLQYWRDPGETG